METLVSDRVRNAEYEHKQPSKVDFEEEELHLEVTQMTDDGWKTEEIRSLTVTKI